MSYYIDLTVRSDKGTFAQSVRTEKHGVELSVFDRDLVYCPHSQLGGATGSRNVYPQSGVPSAPCVIPYGTGAEAELRRGHLRVTRPTTSRDR